MKSVKAKTTRRNWMIMKSKIMRVRFVTLWNKLIPWVNIFSNKTWKVLWIHNKVHLKWVFQINKVQARQLLHHLGSSFLCNLYKNKGWIPLVKKIGIPLNLKSKLKRWSLILYRLIWSFLMLVILVSIWKVLKTNYLRTKDLDLKLNSFKRKTIWNYLVMTTVMETEEMVNWEEMLKEFKEESTVKV